MQGHHQGHPNDTQGYPKDTPTDTAKDTQLYPKDTAKGDRGRITPWTPCKDTVQGYPYHILQGRSTVVLTGT